MYSLWEEESFTVQEVVIAAKIGFSCTAEEFGIRYLSWAVQNFETSVTVQLLET